MEEQAYNVALITRGAGAFAYTWRGPRGLAAGRVCAVTFQGRLELGLVLGPERNPPEAALRALWPVEVAGLPHWGELLLVLCELSASAPDELAGHLLFAAPRSALKLSCVLHRPDALAPAVRDAFGVLCGVLTAPRRKALAQLDGWDELAAAARLGATELAVTVAGGQGTSKAPAHWRRWFELDATHARLLGLDGSPILPGSYLAGFDGFDFAQAAAASPPNGDSAAAHNEPAAAGMDAAPAALPGEWDIVGRWPELADLPIRRRFATWPQLRRDGSLAAELAAEARSGRNVLLLVPQAWMLERLWPQLAPVADRALRFRADASPAAAGAILSALERGGRIVAGGPGAWKLAAYARMDRIVLLDPSHSQYAPEHTPHLDPRLALLLTARLPGHGHPSAAELPRIELIELGLSAFDGACAPVRIMLHPPAAPADDAARGVPADTDPLPLELRRPDRRRLIYFNRLGAGRSLSCAECFAPVPCPTCGSSAVRWSARRKVYTCPECGYVARDLRCPRCGLAMLTAAAPGLEAVRLRPGDTLVQGPSGPQRRTWRTVLGTSQLLEPLPGFWPEEIIFVHAEGRLGLVADWPAAVDTLLRLRALYANAELGGLHIVGARLSEQLGRELDEAAIARHYATELGLRRFGSLPPYGCLYHLRATAALPAQLAGARLTLGEVLRDHPGTELLRLGGAYREGAAHRFGGWLVNPQLGLRELQELRWQLQRLGATLSISALRGPWV